MGLTPGNPVVGGTVLRRAAITSPNFNIANPAASPSPSWGILQNGLAYFFGLILSGGTITGPDYIINSSGAFFYSGTPAAGNLIASIASVPGTDAHGNPYIGGVAAYVKIASGTGAGTYAVALADQAAPYGNNAAMSIQNQSDPASIPPAFVANIDTTDGNLIELHSGKKTAGAVQSSLQLNDSVLTGTATASINADYANIEPAAAAAAAFEVNGSQILDSLTSSPAASPNGPVIWGDSAGFPDYLPASGSGDTTTYAIGHRTTFSTTDEPVGSLSFGTVCHQGAVVGAARYRVRAVLNVTQGATSDFNDFRLGFTGTISQVRMSARFVGAGGAANNVFADVTTSNNGLLKAPAFAAGATYVAEFDGIIVTTSTGTLSVQAACDTNAAHTFTVLALSFFHLERIG